MNTRCHYQGDNGQGVGPMSEGAGLGGPMSDVQGESGLDSGSLYSEF